MARMQWGPVPLEFDWHLTTGSDAKVILTLRAKAGGAEVDWPPGTTLTAEFAGGSTASAATWTATISGAVATFTRDKADADQRPNGESVDVRYVNGTDDLVPWVGRVVRHGRAS